MKKSLAIGIIFLFILSALAPMTLGKNVKISDIKEQPSTLNRGKTLYVGGSGDGNYSTIQSAINAANHGDTVFVYDNSSPYKESNLTIEKSINLIGEDRNTTVIDGENNSIIIIIKTDWVNISGFTIQNSSSSLYACGIMVIMSDNNNISGNIFADNKFMSIVIGACDYNYIVDNIFTGKVVDNLFCTGGGISLEDVSFTNIIGNVFTNCFVGITLWSSSGLPLASNSNIISGNFFDNNDVAMEIQAANTLITRNTISNHNGPLNLIIPALELEGRNNNVSCNNFINNIRDASDWFYIVSLWDIFKIRKYRNVWDGNYWGRPRSLPKIIFSILVFERGFPNPSIPIPFFNIDWHPAKEPYDI